MENITEQTREAKQEKFIELRAKGMSYDKIALQLKVGKPTLISWSKELHTQIHNMREIQRESLLEQFAISKYHRIELLTELLNKIREELASREYSDISTAQLISIAMKLEGRLAIEQVDSITFIKEQSGVFMLDNIETDEWIG